MRTLLLIAAAALIAIASATELVIYPFESQDPVLGAAVADRLAAGLAGDVIGPAASPALVVPLVAPEGFVNPSVFLDEGGLFGRNGAWLLRGVVGARAAATGSLRAEGESLLLDLVVDDLGRDLRLRIAGPRDDPGELADRAGDVLARWLGLERRPLPPLDLRGVDAAHARAVALVGAALPRDALAALDDGAREAALPARAESLRRTLRAVVDGALPAGTDEDGIDEAAVAAVAALNLGQTGLARSAFATLAALGVPVAHAWVGTLAHDARDAPAAAAAFDRAAALGGYTFGVAARAAYRNAIDDRSGAEDDLATLTRAAEAGTLDAAGALAGSLAAGLGGRDETETRLALALGRAAPYLAYAFERRSFLAFDAGDGLAAASALAVAVELEPESDLYWTNFGWALYLIGFLERSEAASRRALEIDPAQYIARYNLALVEVVTGRLDDALASYREARRLEGGVDAEAIADLVDAQERYPDAVGVHFALGAVLEAAGDRQGAAEAFERYVDAVAEAPLAQDADPARAREAAGRAATLRAPLPPIAIEGDVELRLGRRGERVDTARPGDPLVVSFEVATAGDALPRQLRLVAALEDADGAELARAETQVDVPMGAIGFVVDVARLTLPSDLAAGRYTLHVRASGDDQEAEAVRTLEVAGDAEVVRALLGRDVSMLALETNQPLYGPRDAARGEHVLEALVRELRATVDAADEVLPVPEEGRFAGLSGGEIFAASTAGDVRDFIAYLLDEGAQDTSFTFVDGYADWAVAGAP